MRYIAYTTKGLEQIAKEEIENTSNATINEVGDKRIVFETTTSLHTLLQLKTIDDVGIVVAVTKDVQSVDDIVRLIETVNLAEIKQLLATLREMEKNNFSITTSFSKVKGFKPQEVISALNTSITEKYHWEYTEFDHTYFDIRVFIDQSDAYISVRLTKDSLHHRSYKAHSKIGSLKPTVAAALVILATGRKQLKVVDNFCGSGTILLEAAMMGNVVYGGDIDGESVLITKKNLNNLQYASENKITLVDATKAHWQANYFDCAISNLPWDKQIEVKSITDLYEGAIKEYARIVKDNGTICLLLTKPDLMIKYVKRYIPGTIIKTQKIGLLGQNPSIILISRKTN